VIVISLKRLAVSFVIMLLLTAVIIFLGMDFQSGTPVELKVEVENLLFWGIVVLLLQLWVGLSVLLRHRKVLTELGRLAKIEDVSQPHAEKIFNGLGRTGLAIQRLMLDQNRLLVMRANRIAAHNSLVHLLLEGYGEAAAVTDVTGKVLAMSRPLEEKCRASQGAVAGRTIMDFLPEVNLKEVLAVMEKQRTFWQEPEKKGAVCTPVFDPEGSLHFCLWEFGDDRLSGITSRAAKMMKAAKAAKADRAAAAGNGTRRASPFKALADRFAAGRERRKVRDKGSVAEPLPAEPSRKAGTAGSEDATGEKTPEPPVQKNGPAGTEVKGAQREGPEKPEKTPAEGPAGPGDGKGIPE